MGCIDDHDGSSETDFKADAMIESHDYEISSQENIDSARNNSESRVPFSPQEGPVV